MSEPNRGMRNMTEGDPSKHILSFTLPMLLGSFLQQLYNMVDSWVVGNFVGDAALAAVGLGFPVIFLFVSLFMGLSNGATVVIAQCYGAQNMERVHDTVDTVYTAFITGAVPLTFGALLLVRPLLALLRIDPAAYAEAHSYLLIVCGGLVGTIGYNLNAGILRGLGDSKTPLLFLTVATVLNIILDLLFVLAFHWGVVGVAVATITAQAVSWGFGIFYINRHYPAAQIHPFCRRFDRDLFKEVMRIGLPAGVHMSLVSVGMLLVLSKVDTYGKAFSAGCNVGSRLEQMAFLPVQALSFAITTYVGQNMGAQKEERVQRGVRVTVAMALVASGVVALFLIFAGQPVVGLFSPEADVIAAGMTYLVCIMPFYPLFGVFFVLNGAMRGAGDSMFPLINVILSLILVRVPSVYWLANHYGKDMMYYGIAIGWLVGFVLAVVYYRSGKWKTYYHRCE